MTPYYFCFYLFLSVKLISCSEKLAVGVVKKLYNGFDFNYNIIRSYTGLTTLQCARNCFHIPLCASFGYHDDRYCRLYNTTFSSNFSGFKNRYWKLYDLTTIKTCPTDLGYIYNRKLNLCHKFYESGFAQSYKEANETCYSDGGYLIRITSDEIQSYISSFLDSINTTEWVFIGGSRTDLNSSWTYDDQTPLTYFNWKPSVDFTVEYLKYIKTRYNKWILAGGASNRPFICQIHVDMS